MSYDVKLTRPANYRVVEEDQIFDSDKKTIILNRPLNDSTNIIVRLNDFPRSKDFKTEVLTREDVTGQFNGNKDTIYVGIPPIYDGLKLGNFSKNAEDVVVKIKVTDEDVSGQFTGIENYFVTEGKPFLRNNYYDFSTTVTKDDIVVKVNGTPLTHYDIYDINPTTGRVQLQIIPLTTDTVTITYFFKAKIKLLDAENGRIVLKEKPKTGQEVRVQYFARVNDGWDVKLSTRSMLPDARDIVFYRPKNTTRVFTEKENVSSQFTGSENSFETANKPLLPLFQNFTSTIDDALNNAAVVYLNSVKIPIKNFDAENGIITLFQRPQPGDLVQVSYYYQQNVILDRISIDYSVDKNYSLKSTGNVNLADYYVDALGNYEKVERENKLIQDMRKIIATNRGSDRIATWYGTQFEKFIGTKGIPSYVITRISGEIIEALTRLKNVQIQQEEYQEVTQNEFLDYIQKIDVTQNDVDTTYYRAVVDVTTQAGTSFELDEPIIYPEDKMYS